MKAINPYLTFAGTSEEAFLFYRSVFGGEFSMLQRFGDTPMAAQFPAAERNRIMHVALPLKNGTILMATDICESMGQKVCVGTNTSIAIETDSEAEATALFTALSAGGRVDSAPQKMFWGAFYAAWADRFGIQWMVNYTYPRT